MSTEFSDLKLNPLILKALNDEGYKKPTPIQADAIPAILEGRDVLGTAQTGTGKTAAFSVPTLQMLSERCPQGNRFIRALVLTPTRELALQVQDSFRTYGRHLKLSTECVMGGVSMGAQIKRLRARPDILVATPGRLLDLLRQKCVRLDKVEVLVLDEADRMLDMGFVKDVRAIVAATSQNRQTLLFSATLSKEITSLASGMLKDPLRIEVARSATVVGTVAAVGGASSKPAHCSTGSRGYFAKRSSSSWRPQRRKDEPRALSTLRAHAQRPHSPSFIAGVVTTSSVRGAAVAIGPASGVRVSDVRWPHAAAAEANILIGDDPRSAGQTARTRAPSRL